MKKILVVDDSALMRRVMSDIILETKEYIVAYTASNGFQALELIKSHDDILAVFCDINMPVMGGIDLLKKVKELNLKIPFIMISSKQETNDTILALELGCLDFLKKPEQIFSKDNHVYKRNILNALKMAEEVSERNRREEADGCTPAKPLKKGSRSIGTRHNATTKQSTHVNGNKKLIALVCSTGGPKALQRIIPKLPKKLSAPMLIVQHMPAGFTATMAQRLDSLSEISVKEAVDSEILKSGVVYIAKGGIHMKISSGKVAFDDTPPVVGLKPCGDIMYKSLVNSNYDEIICVVLTGMGTDGTRGISELAKTNNIFVIAQDESSSTVYGMPKAIYESGLADCVCDLDDIAEEIVKKVGV